MILPDWALKYKEKGREIRCFSNKYYLYEKYFEYDPKKKKTVWKTGDYIGVITPEGLVPKKVRFSLDKLLPQKSYGSVALLCSLSQDIHKTLRDVYVGERIADSIYHGFSRCQNIPN
ncbi:MAG: hypothetical protein LBF12_03705 [Christensenellaceae bacterium]|jgi:hypothetical protein|nr:hypothetical protein [Christensenellaceae bacterium]